MDILQPPIVLVYNSHIFMKFIQLLRKAAWLWYDKDADHAAATVSYYTLFATAPLLLLTVTLIGIFYGKDFVASEISSWGMVLGQDLVTLLQEAVQNLGAVSESIGIPIIGAIFFSGMVVVMCNTFTAGLHYMWNIPHEGIIGWIKKSFNSVLFILVFEVYIFFLTTFYVVMAFLDNTLPILLLNILHFIFFLTATTVLFSLIFKILPWSSPGLKARLLGAFVAAVMLAVSKVVTVWYVSITPVPGLYGVAGLLLVFLIWIYISTAIVYFGAALAKVYQDNLDEVTRL